MAPHTSNNAGCPSGATATHSKRAARQFSAAPAETFHRGEFTGTESMTGVHDRPYLQARVREELERGRRHGNPFALLTFEAAPSNDGLPMGKRVRAALDAIAPQLRGSDVLARVFEDTIAVLLVETDEPGARDALLRLRSRVMLHAGRWHATMLTYPAHTGEIERSTLLNVA